MTDLVERFIAAFRRTDEEGFTPEIEQELMDTFPAIEALSERIVVLEDALRALYDAEKFHDPDDWRGEPAMIQAWEALGRPQ